MSADVIDRIVDIGRRAPSAGFSQGFDFLVLDRSDTIGAFWEVTRRPEHGWPDELLTAGPTALVLPIPDPARYLDRYARPDKLASGSDGEGKWPVPYWDLDAAMASMLILLAAVDEGLGAWFFGIAHGHRELSERFGVPERLRPIGAIGLGYAASDDRPSGSATRIERRAFDDQIHRNAW